MTTKTQIWKTETKNSYFYANGSGVADNTNVTYTTTPIDESSVLVHEDALAYFVACELSGRCFLTPFKGELSEIERYAKSIAREVRRARAISAAEIEAEQNK